jgi:hypothetical protein
MLALRTATRNAGGNKSALVNGHSLPHPLRRSLLGRWRGNLERNRPIVERAQREVYDQLVAYVGEVLRLRIDGRWQVNSEGRQPYPYLVAAKHDPVMPINVVWAGLSGVDPVNLRVEAANEVRRTRQPPSFAPESATSIRATPPKGLLGTADSFDVCGDDIETLAREVEIIGRSRYPRTELIDQGLDVRDQLVLQRRVVGPPMSGSAGSNTNR